MPDDTFVDSTEATEPAKPYVPSFSVLDRLTTIVFHYLCGPWLGLNLRIFVVDRNWSKPEQFVGVFCVATLTSALAIIAPWHPVLLLAAAFIIFCPQWLYAATKVQHTIFEYRGLMFAVGFASICAWFVNENVRIFGPLGVLTALPLIIALIHATRRRNLIYTDPLLFWRQAHLDAIVNGRPDNMIASAYMYQLQKRERFGDTDDLYKWMTAARVPDCRAFMLNLAAAKFGSKSDLAQFDRAKIAEALKILEETGRRWPDHADVWRNAGTVQYYFSALGGESGDDYSMKRAIEYFNTAIDLMPKDSLAWLSLGHCHAYEGEYELAVDALRHAYNFMPAGAYLVEDISLIRIKLVEALELAYQHTGKPEYLKEFTQHQVAFEQYQAYFVTDENARYIV